MQRMQRMQQMQQMQRDFTRDSVPVVFLHEAEHLMAPLYFASTSYLLLTLPAELRKKLLKFSLKLQNCEKMFGEWRGNGRVWPKLCLDGPH